MANGGVLLFQALTNPSAFRLGVAGEGRGQPRYQTQLLVKSFRLARTQLSRFLSFSLARRGDEG